MCVCWQTDTARMQTHSLINSFPAFFYCSVCRLVVAVPDWCRVYFISVAILCLSALCQVMKGECRVAAIWCGCVIMRSSTIVVCWWLVVLLGMFLYIEFRSSSISQAVILWLSRAGLVTESSSWVVQFNDIYTVDIYCNTTTDTVMIIWP